MSMQKMNDPSFRESSGKYGMTCFFHVSDSLVEPAPSQQRYYARAVSALALRSINAEIRRLSFPLEAEDRSAIVWGLAIRKCVK